MDEFLDYNKFGFIDKDTSLEQIDLDIIGTKYNTKCKTEKQPDDNLVIMERLSAKGNGIARRRYLRRVKNIKRINIIESCQKKDYLGKIKKSQKLDSEGNSIGVYVTLRKNSKFKKQIKKLSKRKNRRFLYNKLSTKKNRSFQYI